MSDASILWGVIIGGAIGLTTTAVGLLYNWIQYRSQRAFSLRQAVYVEAAAAMTRGVEYLASMWRTDLDDARLAEMLYPVSIATNKIHVVGSPPTIRALNRVSECIGISALELAKKRVALQAAEASLEASRNEVTEATSYAQQLASMIDGLPKSAPTPEIMAAIPKLVGEFTCARDRVVAAQRQLENATVQKTQLRKQLAMDGVRAAVKCQQELMEVNIAARRELGLPLDESSYRSEARQSAERMMAAVEQTIQELERAAAQPNQQMEPTRGGS